MIDNRREFFFFFSFSLALWLSLLWIILRVLLCFLSMCLHSSSFFPLSDSLSVCLFVSLCLSPSFTHSFSMCMKGERNHSHSKQSILTSFGTPSTFYHHFTGFYPRRFFYLILPMIQCNISSIELVVWWLFLLFQIESCQLDWSLFQRHLMRRNENGTHRWFSFPTIHSVAWLWIRCFSIRFTFKERIEQRSS